MNTQGAWVVVFLVFVSWSVNSAAKMEKEDETLRRFFFTGSHSNEALRVASKQMPKVCLEVGDRAIPVLSEVILHATPANAEVADIAVDCLRYIGGSKVVQLFKKMYDGSQDESVKVEWRAVLCSSMQSTGSPQDIQFLIESLKGEIFGPESFASRAAAYALAVLKPQSAKAALEKRAKEYKDTPPPYELKLALDRINGLEWKTPQADSARGTDSIILTVFRFGIPHITMSDVFFEKEAGRMWKRNGSEWRFESRLPKSENYMAISFDVFVTKDGKRAICSVGIVCGDVCGYGYDFVLRNEDGDWRIVGLFPTWIS